MHPHNLVLPREQLRLYSDLKQELRHDLQHDLLPLKLGLAQKGIITGESDTALGLQILAKAEVKRLVDVKKGARRAATAWLKRAGEVGEKWTAATDPKSSLAECGPGGTQELFTQLLASQDLRPAMRFFDVHMRASVCGRYWQPDIICAVTQVPSATGLVLDIKRQKGVAYDAPAHIHKVRHDTGLMGHDLYAHHSLGTTFFAIRADCVVRDGSVGSAAP